MEEGEEEEAAPIHIVEEVGEPDYGPEDAAAAE